MSRLAPMIDLKRCIGCKSCDVACKPEHGLGPGEYRNRVVWLGDTEARRGRRAAAVVASSSSLR